MAFKIEGYNTEKKQDNTRDEDLFELDAFEECLKQRQKQQDNELQKGLETVRKQKEQLEKELTEYEQLRHKVEEVRKQTYEAKTEEPKNMERVANSTAGEKTAEEKIEHEMKQQAAATRKSVESIQTNHYRGNINTNSEMKETASDFVESTLEVFGNLGGTVQQFSGVTSKIKQMAHAAWSLKQDAEIRRKFKNAPKVNVGDYTFKVLLARKELMLYSYQGPNTILKLPSMVKDMPITAINPDFLLFRTPKALLNSVRGETIGRDLDSIRQCILFGVF